jgi:hypothetical protein
MRQRLANCGAELKPLLSGTPVENGGWGDRLIDFYSGALYLTRLVAESDINCGKLTKVPVRQTLRGTKIIRAVQTLLIESVYVLLATLRPNDKA